MRHARAESSAETDAERRLTPRASAEAADTGRWLGALGVVPDHALVSAATRTRETWAAVATAAGWTVEPTYDEGLYAADPDTALDLVRAVADEVRTLVVVGHNPTVAVLAQLLDDGEGDRATTDAMVGGFPPGATAVLEVAGSWADLAEGTARTTGFHVGHA